MGGFLEVFPTDDAVEPHLSDQAMFEIIMRLRQASVNPSIVMAGYKRKFQGRLPNHLLYNTRGSQRNREQAAVEDEIIRAVGVPSKTRVLQNQLKSHRDEKAIVFCEFREEMPLLQADLYSVGITSVLYDGSLNLQKRDDIVKRMSWTDQEISNIMGVIFRRYLPREIVKIIASYVSFDVVLVQINSGNAGLNLQMCSKVYFTNLNWNPC